MRWRYLRAATPGKPGAMYFREGTSNHFGGWATICTAESAKSREGLAKGSGQLNMLTGRTARIISFLKLRRHFQPDGGLPQNG